MTNKTAAPKVGRKKVTLGIKAPDAREVLLTGDFTDWDKDGIRLARRANGEWSATMELAPGEYQYRLLVDGEWRDHPESEKRVPNPFGGTNCVLVVR
ncbi:MAG TPA: isoamylase early set domain-containing protein [Planctomycetota bacterium]